MKEKEQIEEEKQEKKAKKETKESAKKGGKNKIIIPIVTIMIVIVIAILFIPNKERNISIKVKSSLERIVEKSSLETVNMTYNVIAKKCKNEKKCDLSSNDIDDFKYVVSCKGQITAGIDFKKIKVEEDKENKKIIITMPEASITGDPNVLSLKFLNGDDIPADELPNARELCQETTKAKSMEDNKLLATAKEQAKVVLEGYYNQMIGVYDSSYKVEIK